MHIYIYIHIMCELFSDHLWPVAHEPGEHLLKAFGALVDSPRSQPRVVTRLCSNYGQRQVHVTMVTPDIEHEATRSEHLGNA